MKRSAVGVGGDRRSGTISPRAFQRRRAASAAAPRSRRSAADLDRELSRLRADIAADARSPGPMRSFRIRDPKRGLIHAPCFRERVLHHAIMAHVGPVLDRSLVFDTYACRTARARWRPCVVPQNMRSASLGMPRSTCGPISPASTMPSCWACWSASSRIGALLALLARIVAVARDRPGRGLPIGALTSQYFANFYLGGARPLPAWRPAGCPAIVRYMDDMVWWATIARRFARALDSVRALSGRDSCIWTSSCRVRIGRSRDGLMFCGYRILPGRLLLSRRRKRRYGEMRRQRSGLGRMADRCTGASGRLCGAPGDHRACRCAAWRREQLRRQPLEPALVDL